MLLLGELSLRGAATEKPPIVKTDESALSGWSAHMTKERQATVCFVVGSMAEGFKHHHQRHRYGAGVLWAGHCRCRIAAHRGDFGDRQVYQQWAMLRELQPSNSSPISAALSMRHVMQPVHEAPITERLSDSGMPV